MLKAASRWIDSRCVFLVLISSPSHMFDGYRQLKAMKCAPGGIRTHTGPSLSRLPLPVGVPGRGPRLAGSIGAGSSMSV